MLNLTHSPSPCDYDPFILRTNCVDWASAHWVGMCGLRFEYNYGML